MLKLNLCSVQRLAKTVLALSIGLFGLLVASGNLVDYESNWRFVQHVLSMDAMQPWFGGHSLKDRAITHEEWHHVAYAAIIAAEAVCGILCSIGGLQMLWGTAKNCSHFFIKGKAWFTLGCVPAILTWYTGVAVIGGEYFAMWGNQWNGQMQAYAFISFILLSLLYISQPEAMHAEA
jgi:predicted small integral membrane protein